MSAKALIGSKAVELLANEPDGLRHSALLSRLTSELPEIPVGTRFE